MRRVVLTFYGHEDDMIGSRFIDVSICLSRISINLLVCCLSMYLSLAQMTVSLSVLVLSAPIHTHSIVVSGCVLVWWSDTNRPDCCWGKVLGAFANYQPKKYTNGKSCKRTRNFSLTLKSTKCTFVEPKVQPLKQNQSNLYLNLTSYIYTLTMIVCGCNWGLYPILLWLFWRWTKW